MDVVTDETGLDEKVYIECNIKIVMLSIIIPTYNEEEYLPKLLESIKKQSYKNYEIIIADASSKDNTVKIAKKYDCKIVKGGSPATGRNAGAKKAKGKYVLFLDSDVILTPEYLREGLSEFKKRELGIAVTKIFPLSEKQIDKILHNFANALTKTIQIIKPHGAGCQGIITTKKLHEEVGGFNEEIDFGEDTDYIERIGKLSKFRILEKPKLFVSTRRLEKEGRGALVIKYTKSTLYQLVGEKITAAKLGYNFEYGTKRKRILYAVNGEGMGHAIRSGVIINHLIKQGHKVLIVSSGRAYNYLNSKFDMVYKIKGFSIIYENNCVNNTKTFLEAMKMLPKGMPKTIRILYRSIKTFKPNIIISDLELFSNIVAKLMRIPMISIDNMHVITNTKIEAPLKHIDSELLAAGVIRTFIVMPVKYLITTFFYPEIKNPKKTALFPPILREQILKLKPKTGDHILVYQTSSSYKKLLPTLKKIDCNFIVYGLNKEKKIRNLQLKKFNEKQFFNDFANCKAAITNGGFTLIGEALHLKKPLLCVPVKKQFEQIFNAINIEELGYGEYHQDLNKKTLEEFIGNLPQYNKNLKKYKTEGNTKIFKEVDSLIETCSKKYRENEDSENK